MTLSTARRASSSSEQRPATSVGHRTANATDVTESTKLERMSPAVVRVSTGGRTIGFIEEVGPVFVTLRGPHYAQAEESHQSLVFAHALRALLDS